MMRPIHRRAARGLSFVGLLVFIVCGYLLYTYGYKRQVKEVTSAPAPVQLHIVIYTQSSCPLCDEAKRWLTQHQLEFQERNIEAASAYRDELTALKSQIVPVLVVNGEPHYGFRSAHFEDLLDSVRQGKAGRPN